MEVADLLCLESFDHLRLIVLRCAFHPFKIRLGYVLCSFD